MPQKMDPLPRLDRTGIQPEVEAPARQT
jgi:hypothetical protein